VRLDRVPGITDDGYFADRVHLNSYGPRLTTPVFLREISESAFKRKPQVPSTVSIKADNQEWVTSTIVGTGRRRWVRESFKSADSVPIVHYRAGTE
jgi:hypothetical protein